jgi:hypothetical protein
MNVASLELCEELYELSGWVDTLFDKNEDTYRIWSYSRADYEMHVGLRDGNEKLSDYQEAYPAYDLGYLLRKLPEGTQLRRNRAKPLKRSNWHGEWTVGIYGVNHRGVYGAAGTPEDAACKLAIELFKQGVLTRETV